MNLNMEIELVGHSTGAYAVAALLNFDNLVQCFTIQGVVLFSWITMKKECRVTVTTSSSSENTGDIFFMKF